MNARPRSGHAGGDEPPGAGGRPHATRRAVLTAAGAALLSACSPPSPPAADPGSLRLPVDQSATDHHVEFANWTQYIDTDDKTGRFPTLEAFTRATGISVGYHEEIDDNDLYVNKISPQLRAGQSINRDIIVLSDWMVHRVIQAQLVQPLELIRMPHASNILPSLIDAPFDPGRQYSLPWQSGLTGIGYDASKVAPIKTIDDLWRADLKGRVVGLSEWRDTIGLVMLWQGVDPAKPFTDDQFGAAVAVIDKQLGDGQIRQIRGNSYVEDLKSGNALAGMVWSGDIATLRTETGNPHWTFVVPESGGMLWSDNAVIPITSTRRRNAERLLDWYYQPRIAAEVEAWVNYMCPVNGAQQAMKSIDPALANDPLVFPSATFLAQHTRVFRALDATQEAACAAMWTKVVGQ